ncbi:MAG: thiolase family protein, partial [Dehalococcoidia bacterium]
MSDSIKGQTAICGLGITPMGKLYGHDSRHFAAEAIRLAVEDAGLRKDEIDGLLINAGITGNSGGAIGLQLQNYLGLHDLRLLNQMSAHGATAGTMVHYAAMAVHHGMANYVVCVFADAPLQKGRSGGAAYGGAGRRGPAGMASLPKAYGFYGANTGYALAARRYMDLYGVTN